MSLSRPESESLACYVRAKRRAAQQLGYAAN
jgi:hypothetical protein